MIVAVIGSTSPERPGSTSPERPGHLLRGQVGEQGDVYPYAVYVPAGRLPGKAMPLVVVLHGCNTTADQMAASTGFDRLADRGHFIVLYPDVDLADRSQARCWKGIWKPTTEGRGRGDAGAIARMTETVAARWHVDRPRVYAIGMSAGAFETPILGAAYPDLYAAIGIHSGAAYLGGDAGCLAPGETPTDTGNRARAALAAMGARARVMPAIVFHGDADGRIPYRCGRQALAQWLTTNDLILARAHRATLSGPQVTKGAVPGGHGYTVASYKGPGCVVLQMWTVHGMGHFWSGGSADPAWARYSDPRGPSAAAAAWAFFSHWQRSGRCTPP